ncbi:glycosyltransferase [Granulicella mallensis]|jgi:glycosyltransferase involved in cell wall biosynthesis|uniref:Glycosyltransferase involved in cell wall biosynthesis n=1 Tax=Granulicella mallensis TaxID=940614 RepID=A0A7W7ZM35_9BACT|nr:glycosyltransferase [Granulicella mallensis]MBB5062408.1 glycosyltransferase involved in cell wall biosynthesis [Granulicella mallensis]
MRVAIVHPWFLALGGAEQSVGIVAELYPDADIFTLFCEKSGLPPQLANRKVISSKWNNLPGKYHFYRHLLPIYPMLFEAIDLRGYDLVLSSDSCVIKGVLLDDETTHVCFCHSPMRCLYDQYREYLEALPWLARPIFKLVTRHLRMWDYIAAQRVTGFATNSQYISQRVRTHYGLESEVVYAPVEANSGYIDAQTEDYYLSVGRLVASKRVDLLIHACNRLGRRLIIVGRGRELRNLKRIAGPTIEFADRVPTAQLASLYARCKALLFAAKEDFGIVPLECQSYGRPVIAYGRGGVLETVIPHVTGLHFEEQTTESLVGAILCFESEQERYDPVRIQSNARSFDASKFKQRFSTFVDLCIEAKRRGLPWTAISRSGHELTDVSVNRRQVSLPRGAAAKKWDSAIPMDQLWVE